MRPRIAFYAPLKPASHPIPSGDRETARGLIRALDRADYDIFVASEVISYQKRASAELFAARRAACEAEAKRLIALWREHPGDAPDLWFTYHPYCKSPDWLGPAISTALGISYVTAEACRTRQDTDADWGAGRAAVREAILAADVNFCLKPSDEAYLSTILPDMGTVARLAPFLDIDEIDAAQPAADRVFATDDPVIVTVGMMRPGAKTESYRLLAQALRLIADEPWNLLVVGDGPERPNVEAIFAELAIPRVHFAGALAREAVLGRLKRGDIFAWPGLREAFGVAYLEAQACGLPVAAFATGGVPVVVDDGRSGLLAPEGDIEAYAAALRRLLRSPAERRALGEAGRRKVEREHGIDGASRTLRAALDPLLRGRAQ